MPNIETDNLSAEFKGRGFVACRGFLSSEELVGLKQNVARFIDEELPSIPAGDVFYEDRSDASTLKQIQRLNLHNNALSKMAESRQLKGIAETLLGVSVSLQNVQYFSKPPSTSKATPAHQDGYYFMLTPCEAVTMWLALDDIDEENGCVHYQPATERPVMRPHASTSTLGFSQGITDYPTEHDLKHEIPVPVSAGDLLVHHALTIHRANANRSADRPRRALGFVYYSDAAKCDKAAHAKYQQQLRQGLKAAGRI